MATPEPTAAAPAFGASVDALAEAAPAAVRTAVEADRARWNEFVYAAPAGTFFHRFEWFDVLTRAFGHAVHPLIAERDGRVVGVLPLARVKSLLFGDALVSTPFCVYGGAVATDPMARRALEDRACALATDLGVDYLELRNRERTRPDWPAKDLYVTFRKPIDAESEKNMLAIPRKQRAMVRKGIQNQLESRLETNVDDVYRMYSESLRNLGTPVFSKRYLQVLQEVFGPDVESLTIRHQGRPVAAVLSFRFRDEILPYYGGGSEAARGVAANDFMYWQVMERARADGLRIFDYGRSKKETGSYAFKCHWGFEPEQLHYEYFLVRAKALPDLSPKNPKYDRMIKVWRKLPLALTHLIGPPVAKYLG
jgi:FemAB-related protein (PEP-CTERM system-associated)